MEIYLIADVNRILIFTIKYFSYNGSGVQLLLGYNEHPAVESRFFCIKTIYRDAKKLLTIHL